MEPSRLVVEIDREIDGRWIADVVSVPGAMAYGATRDEAVGHAVVIALRALAERIEHGEATPAQLGSLLEFHEARA